MESTKESTQFQFNLSFWRKNFLQLLQSTKKSTVLCQSKFLNENFPCASVISKKKFVHSWARFSKEMVIFLSLPQFTKFISQCLGNLHHQTSTLLAHLLFAKYYTQLSEFKQGNDTSPDQLHLTITDIGGCFFEHLPWKKAKHHHTNLSIWTGNFFEHLHFKKVYRAQSQS